MGVKVVLIGRVGVSVGERCVMMPVAVSTVRHRDVRVLVVGIVMPVGVFMLHREVQVLVRVALAQMQPDAGEHQSGTRPYPRARVALAHRDRQQRAYEWRQREDRSGAGRAKSPLREQIQAQAETVAARTEREQPDQRPGRWPGVAGHRGQNGGGRCAQQGLEHHHLARIACGQWTRQGIFNAPSQGGRQDRQQSEQGHRPLRSPSIASAMPPSVNAAS